MIRIDTLIEKMMNLYFSGENDQDSTRLGSSIGQDPKFIEKMLDIVEFEMNLDSINLEGTENETKPIKQRQPQNSELNEWETVEKIYTKPKSDLVNTENRGNFHQEGDKNVEENDTLISESTIIKSQFVNEKKEVLSSGQNNNPVVENKAAFRGKVLTLPVQNDESILQNKMVLDDTLDLENPEGNTMFIYGNSIQEPEQSSSSQTTLFKSEKSKLKEDLQTVIALQEKYAKFAVTKQNKFAKGLRKIRDILFQLPDNLNEYYFESFFQRFIRAFMKKEYSRMVLVMILGNPLGSKLKINMKRPMTQDHTSFSIAINRLMTNSAHGSEDKEQDINDFEMNRIIQEFNDWYKEELDLLEKESGERATR